MAPSGRMIRNRSAPGTMGQELWQPHGFHHDPSKDGGADSKDGKASVASSGAHEPPSAFSAGLSMMTSAFTSRASPSFNARQPTVELRRLRAHTEALGQPVIAEGVAGGLGGSAHGRGAAAEFGGGGSLAGIPLPREYAEDLGRTPDAYESFSRICHLAARGDLPALQRKVAELPPGKLKLAGSLDNRAPLHFAAAAGHVRAAGAGAARPALTAPRLARRSAPAS